MTYLHIFFCYFQDTFHCLSTVPKRSKRNINEELHQAIRTSSDIKVGKDHTFKKYLNAGYPRTFIIQYSIPLMTYSHMRTKIILRLQN